MSQGEVRKRVWYYGGKRHEGWGFTVIIDGKRLRRQGFGSRAEAQDALDELKHPRPVPSKAVASISFDEAFKRYFQVKARKRSLAEDQKIAKHLKVEFGEQTSLSEITASRISHYKAKRLAVKRGEQPLSAAAINRPLALLRHLLRLACEEWEVLESVPKIRLEKEAQGRLRWLTPEEAQRLLTTCRECENHALADLVEFALYTGLRQGEALDLTWDRVDRSRGVVLLELTKSGRRREVPLNVQADAVLARRAGSGKPETLVFGTRSWYVFRSYWQEAVESAGIGNFRFHDLRHTFASWAIQRGATLLEVKDLLGHHSLAMVMRYAHLAPEHLRSAVSRLDSVLSHEAAGSGTSQAREAGTETIKAPQ
jgi:integrase